MAQKLTENRGHHTKLLVPTTTTTTSTTDMWDEEKNEENVGVSLFPLSSAIVSSVFRSSCLRPDLLTCLEAHFLTCPPLSCSVLQWLEQAAMCRGCSGHSSISTLRAFAACPPCLSLCCFLNKYLYIYSLDLSSFLFSDITFRIKINLHRGRCRSLISRVLLQQENLYLWHFYNSRVTILEIKI